MKLSLTLEERKELLCTLKNKKNILIKEDNIKKWRNVKNLIGEKAFKKFLDSFDLNSTDFSNLIDNAYINNINIKKCLELEYYSKDIELLEKILNGTNFFKDKNEELNLDMSFFILPFVKYINEYLDLLTLNLKKISVSDEARMSIINSFVGDIINNYYKVIIMEINGDKEKGNLEGVDSISQYVNFKFKNDEDIITFLLRYPAITRVSVVRCRYFCDYLKEIFERVDSDIEQIRNIFNIENDELTSLSLSLGDTHQQGRSVAVLEFGERKVVYKPRNLEVEKAYYNFIEWINSTNELLQLKTIKGIYRKKYTWQEFVENHSCDTSIEIDNYYRRFGYLVAISYLLSGNDFHLENVIASASHPVIIDLETIIQPERDFIYSEDPDYLVSKEVILNSVAASGLLPILGFGKKGEKGIDISALNGKSQKLPFKVLLPSNLNTLNMKYEYKEYIRPGGGNIPLINNIPCEFENYTENIISGFNEMMYFFLSHKKEILSEEGKLNEFKDRTIRVVIKNTNAYRSLLDYSNHPAYCKTMLLREKLLENLWAYPHKNEKLFYSEYKDMLFGDIPIFFTNTTENFLVDSYNNKIEDYFEKSGYQNVVNRIKELTIQDISRQESILRIHLKDIDIDCTSYEVENETVEKTVESFDLENLIRKRISENFELIDKEQYYISKSNSSTWVSLIFKDSYWSLAPMDLGLYSGLSGVALTLSVLKSEVDTSELFERVMNTIKLKYEFSNDFSVSAGLFGVVYLIACDYRISRDKRYLYIIKDILKRFDEILPVFSKVDWLNGLSGILAVCCTVNEILPDFVSYDFIQKIINRLLILLELNKGKEDKDIGFAHGISGIIFSLSRGYKVTNNPVLLSKCKELLDMIVNKIETVKDNISWCRGSVGMFIALSNLKKEGIALSEIESYLHILQEYIMDIVKKQKGQEDCMCHGTLALLEYQEYQTENYEDIKIIDKNLLHKLINNDRLCIRELPGFLNSGLFTGRSGIIYQFSRVINGHSETFPNVYLLK